MEVGALSPGAGDFVAPVQPRSNAERSAGVPRIRENRNKSLELGCPNGSELRKYDIARGPITMVNGSAITEFPSVFDISIAP